MLTVFFLHDILSVVKPDYQVALITQNNYSDGVISSLQTELAKNGTDLNSDGKVVVQVNSYVISGDSGADMNAQMAGVVKLDADYAAGSSMIFLTDDASFQKQQKQSQAFAYLDGSVPAESATDYSRMRVALKDCKALSALGADTAPGGGRDLLNNISISMRVFQENAKDKGAYYEASKKLFDKFISGR